MELADGRVLFLPRGRGGPAYQIADESRGWKLESVIEWADSISRYSAMAIVTLVGIARWWWILGLLPLALLGPYLTERWITAGLSEAVDPAARRATMIERAEEAASGRWALLASAVLVGFLAWLWMRAEGKAPVSPELVIGAIAVALGLTQLLRKRRLQQERRMFEPSAAPENKPIVPR